MRTPVVLALALLCAVAVQAQPTVTAPAAGTTNVGPADDFATTAFQDPWDMNEYTDVGWFTLGNDTPHPGLSNITVSGGLFTGNIINNDPNFWLLDTRIPGNATLGKTGANFPIDATKYQKFLISMCLTGLPGGSAMQLLWSNSDLFTAVNTTNAISTFNGCRIYFADLPTLGGTSPWTGVAQWLRVDPTQFQGSSATLSVDWARIVATDATLSKTITWTGSSSVDIYLDTDANSGNGGLVQIASSVAGSSFGFYVGAVQPGDYFVRVCNAGGTSSCGYSPGKYRVLAQPTMKLTTPNEEGSADDFATMQLGDPWDMTSLNDIDLAGDVTGLAATTVAAVDEAGNNLGSVNVVTGTSVNANRDPRLYMMVSTKRGANYRIDTNRYRLLTAEMGLPGLRDLVAGSIARMVWKISDTGSEDVSEDIDINHRTVSAPPGAIVIAKFSADMKDAAHLPPDAISSPDSRGWINGGAVKPGLDNFRIDPHEFFPATPFWVRRVKLTALEKVGSSFNIQWTSSNPSAIAGLTVKLIAASPVAPGAVVSCTAGSPITITASVPLANGAFNWSSVPAGFANGTERHICAQIFNGGTQVDQVISRFPVLRDVTFSGTLPPRLAPARQRLNFGGSVNASNNLQFVTPPQVVTLSQLTAGAGVTWSASVDQSWLTVSPPSGSSTGNITVQVINRGSGAASQHAVLTITSSNTIDPVQYIDVYLSLKGPGATAAAFGSFDSPANGANVQGAIPVTGWALDDVGVSQVQLWRDPVNGDGPPQPNGKIFIGNAVFVNDARPDVEAANPTVPQPYRAAWGYMLLTNLLPNTTNGNPAGGVGSFTLYAYVYDVEGHVTLLPSKTINATNNAGNKPFGTIDTPGQGATVSGMLDNFGWALTPKPPSDSIIPTNGSTVQVFVDGVFQGTAQYNLPRSDIQTLFPGYNNTNGAIGYFQINTTLLANGVHTIFWIVTDNYGRADGLGSRYFTVLN